VLYLVRQDTGTTLPFIFIVLYSGCMRRSSRCSSISIASRLRDGWTAGFQFPVGAVMGFSSSPPRPDRFWGLPSFLYSGYREALSPVVKRPGRETDHLPPFSA